ncbi:MAG: hypothetical protein A3I44_03520 [Candidatus Sungbacteria bacterium RIFCSPLOWO2_02_FULL_51_17]|uniref:Acetyl-CoA acetyltransferase n=1 Tax=Candidatus Sungbacteria bacterium RIFCSPHIGHO2_02_FULL_51_29 TaxID=1802273 RepID=A0A1G2KU16_9BACT|nr:MAG: hypothetical protein A2676_01395 [Candidatus Sungbacteria bacterium RIFCSPHIGHO2_01_FULL_51_22]OHA02102.1 MAG: hypothetical protein A3C16_04800 [Candidatus Sungbacteria bacterium RIFCSPHIGHO2_02_FULL_51_29]OHA06140.1 MAG: hypothetical protein A3B29_01730 [Candidatus Sungbacteria bacterium RIFCSPLOWO2_01_FULL_51_34]OHA10458.1 MAG: hypothetical protein A3I44_03520 [Candidatus Sungbacteria bacterium RIFCSPLOWO2_02_FULL_51_17]
MEPVYITGAVRTPIGSFLGSLKEFSAPQLGATCLEASITLAGIPYRWPVDYCVMGNVYQAGVGQAPALQAVRLAESRSHMPARTVNKLCGSGLDAVIIAAQSVMAQQADIVLAGGMESMSNAKFLLDRGAIKKKAGTATKDDLAVGDTTLIYDSLIFDGLEDAYTKRSMGECAELCAMHYDITREEQDAFAIRSYTRAIASWKGRDTESEIVCPHKGKREALIWDEELGKFNESKLRAMPPVFDKEHGTITAANASKISDGAASMVVISERAKEQYRMRAQARILEWATVVEAPEWFTIAPIAAIRRLDFWRKHRDKIDLFEINEAFAPVVIAATRELNIPEEKVNIAGGAIAMGHPIGASGARILVTLIHNLRLMRKKIGVAAVCIGGGEAIAMVIETVEAPPTPRRLIPQRQTRMRQ